MAKETADKAAREGFHAIVKVIRHKVKRGKIVLRTADPEAEIKALALKAQKAINAAKKQNAPK